MLTLLRKFRRSLIESNQVRKYMFYAIGEITLVVVGILIALQINNWNEYRKERKEEIEVLESLKYTIERNIGSLNFWITTYRQGEVSSDIFLEALDRGRSYDKSMDSHFNNALFKGPTIHFSREGYEVLKNKGFDIIVNDSLKNGIIYLFDGTYEIHAGRMNYNNGDAERISAYVDQNFKRGTSSTLLSPYEPNKLFEDQYFQSLLLNVKHDRKLFLNLAIESKEESEQMLHLINDKLTR